MKWVLSAWVLLPALALAQTATTKNELNQRLDDVREKRLSIEKALIDAEKTKKSTEDQLKRLKTLQRLQTQEKALTEQRLATLEKYLVDLRARKEDVNRKNEFRHVADIPITIQMDWLTKHGVDVWNQDHWPAVRRLLNDPDYRWLKTKEIII